MANGSRLAPRLDISLRHDGGDAESGLGVDIGGGLVWSNASRVLLVELETRSLIAHEVTGFRDWSVSGLVRYDPNPSSARGVSALLRSSIAMASIDGVDALLGRDSLTIPEVHGGSPRRQLAAEAAYGFAILGGHLTGAPWAGIGLLGEWARL